MIDWDNCKTIDSDSELPDIEKHFRIFAGPGAGKTHWLIKHIKNVVKRSKRLGLTRKIACITYTNSGAEEIQGRLKQSAERVEVKTIHSFLYSNIVKPYGFLLKNEDGKPLLNIKALDGHVEHIPNPKFVYDWKCDQKLVWAKNNKKVHECLLDLDWCFQDENNELICLPKSNYKRNVGPYWIKEEKLGNYKNFYWNVGILHHEDVLYFSYSLIKKFPEILDFLRAKFPYVYVDEFQDTNPIQTAIMKKIGESGSIVGVIGDPAQSIYGFQGACRNDFECFIFDNQIDYKIENNRRSTEKIIQVLNHIRSNDIEQKSINKKNGVSVKVYVGPIEIVMENLEKKFEITPVVLTRRNDYAGQIKSQKGCKLDDLWKEIRSVDSNSERTNFLYSILLALELSFQKNFKESIKTIERCIRRYKNKKIIPKYTKQKISVALLIKIVNEWNYFKETNLREFGNHYYNYLLSDFNIKIGAAISSGKAKAFAEKWSCSDMIQCLRVKEDISNIRTIHKAKGSEFETVFVALESEDDLKHIISPTIESEDDECRIYYVALSRAKNNLIICIPTLDQEKRDALHGLKIEIHDLN
ncbi:MAG: ATP-dependent helicase [Desulfobacula sp.]|nr:ATP-dependent helicase [Desulfobacula sp.]